MPMFLIINSDRFWRQLFPVRIPAPAPRRPWAGTAARPPAVRLQPEPAACSTARGLRACGPAPARAAPSRRSNHNHRIEAGPPNRVNRVRIAIEAAAPAALPPGPCSWQLATALVPQKTMARTVVRNCYSLLLRICQCQNCLSLRTVRTLGLLAIGIGPCRRRGRLH